MIETRCPREPETTEKGRIDLNANLRGQQWLMKDAFCVVFGTSIHQVTKILASTSVAYKVIIESLFDIAVHEKRRMF
jgi:hypothetical protein